MLNVISLIILILGSRYFSGSKLHNGKLVVDSEHYFKVSSANLKLDGVLNTGWYYTEDTNTLYIRQLEKTEEYYYFIDPAPITSAKDFIRINIYNPKEK